MNISQKTYQALKVLENTSREKPMLASQFAKKLWGDDESKQYLFSAAENINSFGKKAWIMAGTVLGKLSRQGFVRSCFYAKEFNGKELTGYYLSEAGLKAVRDFESQQPVGQ